MTESKNLKTDNLQRTEHNTAEPEKIVKKTEKRGRKPSAKKKGFVPYGQLQKILAAVIILCLGLVGFIIFILTSDTTPPVIQQVSISDIDEASVIVQNVIQNCMALVLLPAIREKQRPDHHSNTCKTNRPQPHFRAGPVDAEQLLNGF